MIHFKLSVLCFLIITFIWYCELNDGYIIDIVSMVTWRFALLNTTRSGQDLRYAAKCLGLHLRQTLEGWMGEIALPFTR